MKRSLTVGTALGLILTSAMTAASAQAYPAPSTGSGVVRPQSGHGTGYYGVWATNVNVRAESTACYNYPSTTNCTPVIQQVSSPQQVWVYCQKAGQTIGINPYWVLVDTSQNLGWMASYYIDNATNWIDGVPVC
jgi:hypothetical protein